MFQLSQRLFYKNSRITLELEEFFANCKKLKLNAGSAKIPDQNKQPSIVS